MCSEATNFINRKKNQSIETVSLIKIHSVEHISANRQTDVHFMYKVETFPFLCIFLNKLIMSNNILKVKIFTFHNFKSINI